MGLPRLADVVEGMSRAAALRRLWELSTTGYVRRAYRSGLEYVKDPAAVAIVYSQYINQCGDKGHYVWKSLQSAATPTQVEYLLNVS